MQISTRDRATGREGGTPSATTAADRARAIEEDDAREERDVSRCARGGRRRAPRYRRAARASAPRPPENRFAVGRAVMSAHVSRKSASAGSCPLDRGAPRHLHARSTAPRRTRRRPVAAGSVRASCRRPRARAAAIARMRRRRIGLTSPRQPRGWVPTPTPTRTRTRTPTSPPAPNPPARRTTKTRSWTRWPSFARTRRAPSSTSARAARRDSGCTSGRLRATTTTSPRRRRQRPRPRPRPRPRRRRAPRRENVRARRTPSPPTTATFPSPCAPSAKIAQSTAHASRAATPSAAGASEDTATEPWTVRRTRRAPRREPCVGFGARGVDASPRLPCASTSRDEPANMRVAQRITVTARRRARKHSVAYL